MRSYIFDHACMYDYECIVCTSHEFTDSLVASCIIRTNLISDPIRENFRMEWIELQMFWEEYNGFSDENCSWFVTCCCEPSLRQQRSNAYRAASLFRRLKAWVLSGMEGRERERPILLSGQMKDHWNAWSFVLVDGLKSDLLLVDQESWFLVILRGRIRPACLLSLLLTRITTQ